jgi:hypothetical protein
MPSFFVTTREHIDLSLHSTIKLETNYFFTPNISDKPMGASFKGFYNGSIV